MYKDVISADVIYDIQMGDCGKGKVSSFLSSQNSLQGGSTKHYHLVARWAGGANAGHTVYVGNKKYKTHLIPSGVFHGVKSLVGPGCVVNLESLKKELNYLHQNGFNIDLVKISPMAHIVTEEHIQFDKDNLAKKLGTTSSGIAPAYGSKYSRVGVRFADIAENNDEVIQIDNLNFKWSDLLYKEELSGNILCEGAQGFYLDINWGNYPFVTSSETLPYAACSIGFSPTKIKNIYAVAKIYETRSGEDPDFPDSLFDNQELATICEVGMEYGVTTGRRRKVNYLNLNKAINALRIGGGNILVMSKCDILEATSIFRLFYNDELLSFNSISEMKLFIEKTLLRECSELKKIYFSSSPEIIENFSF